MKKSFNIFLIISFALLFLGCATKPVKVNNAKLIPTNRVYTQQVLPGNNKAKVIFVRDTGLLGSAIYQHLYIDGKKVAEIMPSEKLILELKPGEHVFDVIPTDPFGQVAKSSITVDLKANKTYYYRILMDGRTFKSYIQRFIYNPSSVL